MGLARVVTDILVLGLLVALRFCLRRGERTSLTVSAVALVLLAMSDMLRILLTAPGIWYGMPLAATCSMTGLFLVAAAPWLPGGASVVGVDQREMPVVGVVAAFVPVVVCVLAMAAHTCLRPHRCRDGRPGRFRASWARRPTRRHPRRPSAYHARGRST